MLTYDEIPPERLPIRDATGRLGDEGHLGVLGVALAEWAASGRRPGPTPTPGGPRTRAMDALDSAARRAARAPVDR